MATTKICRYCLEKVNAEATVCKYCGKILIKSKTTTILLAFFFGGLGIHKFYLGKIMQGILYFIFAITYIPAFIAFCESILLLFYSDADWELYLEGKKDNFKNITLIFISIFLAMVFIFSVV